MTISPDGVINIQNEGPVNIAGLTNNVTIGANSMVIKDIPDNCMVGGNPTRDHLATTFEVREDVRDYCFHLFWNKPLFGIGQGNFKVINNKGTKYFNNLIEPESSWLQILTEGGLFYLLTMLFFFFKPIKDAIIIIFTGKEPEYSYYYMMGFSFFLVFAVIFLFNDFADSLFWLSAGIMTSLIACDKNKVPQVYITINQKNNQTIL